MRFLNRNEVTRFVYSVHVNAELRDGKLFDNSRNDVVLVSRHDVCIALQNIKQNHGEGFMQSFLEQIYKETENGCCAIEVARSDFDMMCEIFNPVRSIS